MLRAPYDTDSLDQRDPAYIERMVRFAERVVVPYHRAQVRGVDRVPPGAALYVGNHNAMIWTPDTYVLGAALYRRHGLSAVPYGLGHGPILQVPLVNRLLVPMGAVRASHENAMRLFARGDKALVYPGGDVDAMRPYARRHEIVFGQRRGYIRLALAAGVPVIPVVTAGAHGSLVILTDAPWLARALRADRWFRLKVWPVSIALPWGLMPFPGPFIPFPARFVVEILDPITFDRSGPEAAADAEYVHICATHVEGVMQHRLTELADELRR